MEDVAALKGRVADLEEVLTLICGAFPTVLIGSGDPHVPNAKVRKVCAELRARAAGGVHSA